MNRLLLRSLVLFVLVSSAQAADMPMKAPLTPALSWTGFYFGANVGGGWGNQSVGYAPNDSNSAELFTAANGGGPPATSFLSSGALAGVQAGYNWQTQRNWLIGVEADIDWSGIKGSGSSSYLVFPTSLALPAASPINEQTLWFGTVRGRLGYLPTQNLLGYFTGGFAYGQIKHTGSYINESGTAFGVGLGAECNADATCFAGSSTSTAVGWTVGGGLEYAVSQRLSIKAEYLYVSLGSTSLTETALVPAIGAPAGTPLSSINANFDHTNFNVVRIGSNFRF
jgi:outer membrane immunogenic protein